MGVNMLGEKLKTQRQESGFTQSQVASMLNVSRKTILKWENDIDYPDIPTLIKISDIYQVSLDYLVRGDQDLLIKFQKDSNKVHYLKKIKRRFGIIGAILFVHFGDSPRWGKGNFIFWLFTVTFEIYMNICLLIIQICLNYFFNNQATIDFFRELCIFGLITSASFIYGLWAQAYLTK